jgi:hypothetical protein
MNITCRILLGLGLTGAVAAALGYFWTVGSTPQAPPTMMSEQVRSPEEEERRRALLDLYRARLFHSMEIKRQVAEELLDGRLTLFQAVVQFQRAEQSLPAAAARLRALRTSFPGNSDAERCAARSSATSRPPGRKAPGRAVAPGVLNRSLIGNSPGPVPPPE